MSFNIHVLFIIFLVFSSLNYLNCKEEVKKINDNPIVYGIVFYDDVQLGGWPAKMISGIVEMKFWL